MDAAAPAARFALIIELLCRAVAARGAQGGFAWMVRGACAGPPTILLWTRLRRTAARFTTLAASLQNQGLQNQGLQIEAPQANPRRAQIRKPRPAQPRVAPGLPRRFAWLLGPVPEAASSASQLRHLLADPGMQELIAADPRFGRILRPLCHTIGIRPPPFLRLARIGPSPAPMTMQANSAAPPPLPAPAAAFRPPIHPSGHFQPHFVRLEPFAPPPAPAAFAEFSSPNEQRAPPAFA